MTPAAPPPPRSPRTGLVIATTIVVGVAASLALLGYTRSRLARDQADEYVRQIDSRHALIRETLASYEEGVFSLGLMFRVDEHFTTTGEFSQAARALLTRHPGVLGLQWAPLVTAAQRADWEKSSLATTGVKLALVERAPGGRDIPAKDRPEYFPIQFAEPFEANHNVLGSDAAASPMRAELARARDTDRIRFSGLLKLVYETGRDDGIVMICPVSTVSAGEVAPRFRGYVLGIFRIKDLLAQPWRFAGARLLDVMFVDESATRPDRRVLYYFSVSDTPGPNPPTEAEFRARELRSIPLPIGGRNWTIHYRPAAAERHTSLLPFASLALGLAATGLLAAFLAAHLRRTELVERLVSERTAELTESRRKLDSFLRAMPGMAFRGTYDDKLNLSYVSDGVLTLSGWTAADLLSGQVHLRDIIHPEDLPRVRATTRESIESRRPVDVQYRIKTRAGAEKWVLSRGHSVHVAGSPPLVEGLVIDITAQKSAENARLTLERKLLEGQKLESLGLLAGGIAHDFNNLLTSIMGNAGIVRLALPAGNPLDEKLVAIEDGATRAADLCRQMLAYAGQGRFVVEAVDLSALTAGLVPLLEISIERKAALKLQLARPLPAVVVDATQIKQIVMSLVLNAVDAVAEGTGEILLTTGTLHATRATLDAAVAGQDLPEGDYVLLDVRDNGAGMPPEVLSRIFDPFFTTKFAGRGLGLAAVLGIVRGHHGALTVESAPGRGSVFRLLLPVAQGVAVPQPPPPPTATAWTRTGNALIIDDDEPVRIVASAMMKSFGFSVETAPDGQRGLDLFRAKPGAFDIVLLDLLMPVLNGEQTLAILRTIQPDLPVLIVSGYSESDVMQRLAHDRGRFKFLHKPFKRPELEQKLREMLG